MASDVFNLIQEMCPNGVPYVPITEAADYVRGVTYKKSDEGGDGRIQVLRANNITLASNTLNFNDVKKLSSKVKIRDDQRLYLGDILICAGSGSREHIGKVAYIDSDLPHTFGGFMGVVRTKETHSPRFLHHLLTSKLFSDYLDKSLSTSTINNLNKTIMSGFKVPTPPGSAVRDC
ncbi:MAG: restriction endonuclease subunit S [Microbacteriaceae bacterium]|nr:restriction endonuclease subunit S [Microbacteriaceae bacterium]